MKQKFQTSITVLTLLSASATVLAQNLVITVTLGPNQIGQIKTTQGITTRVMFSEPVKDIICGDLYDPATGKGSFVVQRIENDVFLKPVVPKGMSNLFVKTGQNSEHTYSFDLQVVPSPDQAHRVVNVTDAPISQSSAPNSDSSEGSKKTLLSAQLQSDEIIRKAKQQADRIITNANQQASDIYAKALQRSEDLDRSSAERSQREVEDRFVRAMIHGVKEVKSADSHVAAKRITITLDPRVLIFDDKSYLRYMIKNNGEKEFAFASLSLERRFGKESFIVPVKVIQGRTENRVGPGETIMGIIVYDLKEIGAEDRLTLFVRGVDNSEIARLSIQ
jgi:vacuolar-type H+-ATPase subunit H